MSKAAHKENTSWEEGTDNDKGVAVVVIVVIVVELFLWLLD